MQVVVKGKGKGLPSVMLSGFYCFKRKRSKHLWSIRRQNFFREKQNPWVLQYSQLYIFGFLCVGVSVYIECNKKYTDKSFNELLYVYVSAPQFLSYLPTTLDQDIILTHQISFYPPVTSAFSLQKNVSYTLNSHGKKKTKLLDTTLKAKFSMA